MIEQLSNPDPCRKKIESIFRSTNPFRDSGRDKFPVKAVLYPENGYHLNERQFIALTETLDTLGEEGFFVSQVEAEIQNEMTRSWNWFCSSPSYDEYQEMPLVLENAHYSLNETWGILISHEMHGLLVAQKDFWDIFRSIYPIWDEDHARFKERWEEIEEKPWYEGFLSGLTEIPSQSV